MKAIFPCSAGTITGTKAVIDIFGASSERIAADGRGVAFSGEVGRFNPVEPDGVDALRKHIARQFGWRVRIGSEREHVIVAGEQ